MHSQRIVIWMSQWQPEHVHLTLTLLANASEGVIVRVEVEMHSVQGGQPMCAGRQQHSTQRIQHRSPLWSVVSVHIFGEVGCAHD